MRGRRKTQHSEQHKTVTTPNQQEIEELEALEELENLETIVKKEKQNKEGVFQSPIMKKTQQQLDVALLREEIPHFQAGKNAKETMNDSEKFNHLTREEQEQLQHLYNRGQKAKETLYLAALPLIKIIAHKEWRRRQQWASQIPYEDLIQDATLGFLKGLEAFRVESIDKSSTNYLGQWMLVEMRRSSENMDHDLQVSNEAGERFRRIRALRTRLTNDLGREPTNEEIVEASRNPQYITRPTMVGKAKKEGEKHAAGKGVTLKQVEMEKESRNRMGTATRIVSNSSGGDKETRPAPGTIDPERSTDSGMVSHDPADTIMEQNSQEVISGLVAGVIKDMKLPTEQVTIISLRYGLPPYNKEHSVREISTATDIGRSRVTKILNAFNNEMTTQGGTFHKHIQQYPVEELLAVDLGWILDTLGPWDHTYDNNPKKPNRVLTTVSKTTEIESVINVEVGKNTTQFLKLKQYSSETQAFYTCTFHNRTFSRLYENRRSVPKNTPCPACSKPSDLTHTNP